MLRRDVLLGTSGFVLGLAAPVGLSTVRSLIPKTVVVVTYVGRTKVEDGLDYALRLRDPSIRIIYKDAGESDEKLAEIMAELVRLRPDCVVTWGTNATKAIVGEFDNQTREQLELTLRTPVVFTAVTAPIASRLVRSWSNHGRNLTGVSHIVAPQDQVFDALRLAPITNLGAIYSKDLEFAKQQVSQITGVLLDFEASTIAKPIDSSSAKNVEEAIHELAAPKIDWLYIPSDFKLLRHYERVIEPLTRQLQLKTLAASSTAVEKGALCGRVAPLFDIGQQAAGLVIQAVTAPGGIKNESIEGPRNETFMVNSATAAALGIQVKPNLFKGTQLI